MRKHLFILALLSTLLLTACSIFSSKEEKAPVDGIPFQTEEGGRWSMMTPSGEVIFKDEFKGEDAVTISRNGIFFVLSNEVWKMYTTEKQPKQIGGEYLSIAPFTEDVTLAVEKGKCITIIDREGKVKKTLDKNILEARPFCNGYSVITTDKGMGLMDTEGNIVIEPKYCQMFDVSDDKVLAVDNKYKDLGVFDPKPTIVLNTKGEELFTIKEGKYTYTNSQFVSGRLSVTITDENYHSKCGFIDEKGEEIIRPTDKLQAISAYNDEYFVYSDGEDIGLKNFNEESVIRPKYNYLELASEARMIAGKEKTGSEMSEVDESDYYLVDMEGNELSTAYANIIYAGDGEHYLALVRDNQYVLLDADGKEIKETPDNYTASMFEPSSVITSDYVDLDGIVSQCGINTNKLGDFSLNMTIEQMAQIIGQREGIAKDDVTMSKFQDANYYEVETPIYKLRYAIAYEMELAPYSMAIYDDATSTWNWNEDLFELTLTISGSKLEGKYDKLFDKVKAHLKTLGTVYKENAGGISITLPQGGGIVAINNDGQNIEIEMLKTDTYKDYQIELFTTNPDGSDVATFEIDDEIDI